MPANPLISRLNPKRAEAATLRKGVGPETGPWALHRHCEGSDRVGFSESLGMKVREASGNSSGQVRESNPVLQTKYLSRTVSAQEASWVGTGILPQNSAFFHKCKIHIEHF